jgi:hypothetical protein
MSKSVPQLNFVGGEWSPSLYGRTDLEKYATAVRLMKNFFAHPHGGVSNRGGTQFIANAKSNSGVVRLIPFQFSVVQAYELEFSDQCMRVIMDGALVIESAGAGTDIVKSGTYKWTASGSGTNEYYLELDAGGGPGLDEPEYVYEDVGGADTTMSEGTLGSLAAGEYAYGDNDSLGYSTIYVRLSDNSDPDSKADGYLEAGYIFELALPYDEADLPLVKFTQSFDTLYLTHPSYQQRKITRTAHDIWTISVVTIGAGIAAPASPSMGGTGNNYVVTAVNALGEESVASVAEEGAPTNTLTWTVVSGAIYYNVYKDWFLCGVYGFIGQASTNSFTEASSITPDYTKVPPQNNNPFSGAGNYPGVGEFFEQRLVYARPNNAPQTFFGSVIAAFDNFNISIPNKDDDSYEFTLNAEQVNEVRWIIPLEDLILLTSSGEWRVRPGSGDSSITQTSVDAKRQSQWGCANVRPLKIGNKVLFIETSGNVIRDLGYSYDSDDYTGENLCIFAEHLFRDYNIVEWCYQQNPDSIIWAVRNDGTLLGLTYFKEQQIWGWHRHETNGKFKSISCIRTAGGVDEVYVVVEREINGSTVKHIEKFMPRLSVRDDYVTDVKDSYFVDDGLSLDDPYDISNVSQADPCVLTVVGHPYSNGDYVDIVEVEGMTEINNLRFKVANAAGNNFSLQDQDGNDIDSSEFTAYSQGGKVRKAYLTLAGLDHLEGETVKILADGNVVSGKVVTGGSITLNTRASRVHVGLGYTSDIETLDFEYATEGDDTVQDKERTIPSVAVRVRDTRAIQIGTCEDDLYEVWFRENEDYDQPTELFSGIKEVSIDNGDSKEGRLFVRNTDPLPLTILTLTPRLVDEEED